MGKKIMVAMSGGVDSSAAALLLMEEGMDLCGATLRLFVEEEKNFSPQERNCGSEKDVEDAARVCEKLGIPHFVFDMQEEFREKVIQRFGEAYTRGRTPNPCIFCNRYIKFGKLIDEALRLGYEGIATGHYARIEYNKETDRYLLKKAKDATKDQTYVLYTLTQRELSRTIFPLGDLLKTEVRELALSRGFVNARKKDSQDICFVKDGDYVSFLENQLHMDPLPGDFVDREGNFLGHHDGLIRYTIGQRRGLRMGFGSRKYVVRLDPSRNEVVLGENEDLFCDSFHVEEVNLILVDHLEGPMEVMVKTRYKQAEVPATISSAENGRILVKLEKAQRAVTPGQAAVFYLGDHVLGGGTIV